jgi:hypothetical protein
MCGHPPIFLSCFPLPISPGGYLPLVSGIPGYGASGVCVWGVGYACGPLGLGDISRFATPPLAS